MLNSVVDINLMLQGRYYEQHQAFWQNLYHFKTVVSQNVINPTELQGQFLTLQQFFQLQVASLDLTELEATTASKVQAIHTEINKQLRLLGMDVMFLQAARQSTTAQKRQAQMLDRLTMLTRYCDALLDGDDSPSAEGNR